MTGLLHSDHTCSQGRHVGRSLCTRAHTRAHTHTQPHRVGKPRAGNLRMEPSSLLPPPNMHVCVEMRGGHACPAPT